MSISASIAEAHFQASAVLEMWFGLISPIDGYRHGNAQGQGGLLIIDPDARLRAFQWGGRGFYADIELR
jgi:hypothetical protein